MELIKDINKVTYDEFYDEERPIVLIEYSLCHRITVSFGDNCLMEITPIVNENVKEFYRLDGSSELSELNEIYNNLFKKHKYLKIVKVNKLKSIIQREAFDEYEDKIRLFKLSLNDTFVYKKVYLGTFPRYIVEQILNSHIDYIYETLNTLFKHKNDKESNIWNRENLQDIVSEYDYLMKSLDNVYYDDEKLDVLEYLTLSEFSDKYDYCKKHIDMIKAEYL